MIILIGYKMDQTFDFMFQEINNPILILNGKNRCKKFNNSAKKLLGDNDSFLITQNMDKDSQIIWHEFIQKVMTTPNAACHINIHFPNQTTSTPTLVKGHYHTGLKEIILYITFPYFGSTHPNISIENKYTSFFNYAKLGIVISNELGEIVDLNSPIESFFSIKKENLIGQKSEILLNMFTDSQKEILTFLKKLETTGYADMVCCWSLNKEDKQYYQFVTMYDERNSTYVTMVRDDTEKIFLRKQVEQNNNLSVLGQMAASIAHEIRNPMTSLKGFTQLLNYTVNEEGKEYLKVIHNELDRMESILNEFLILSKPTERSVDFVSVSDLLAQIIDFMYPQAIMNNVELHLEKREDVSYCILGDEKELKKAIMNILKNGIEEMAMVGGIITINQTLFDDNKLKISIQDKGKGLSQEEIRKVFLPFFTTKKNGTGLGLPHVLQTIEDHGGYIEVESEIGQSTTFHLILPLYRVDTLKENPLHDQNFTKSFR
ncbi:MAG: ATP-binding protein [Paenisporosarcina sp.]